jgi:isopropylmalate/homocitrate/citramalate synthase
VFNYNFHQRNIRKKKDVAYSALVPNKKGLEHAVTAGVDKISVFTAASESFNLKNINTTVIGSLARFRPLIEQSKELSLPVRGYISTAFWCPFAPGATGNVATESVVTELIKTGEKVNVNIDKLNRACDVLTPYLPKQVPAHPALASLACTTCQFFDGSKCCGQ